MASHVARGRARARENAIFVHARAAVLFVVACATLVPRLARADSERWLLTTLTRASPEASEDANAYPTRVTFTLDAFGTTFDADVRANGELTSRDCSSKRQRRGPRGNADGERRRGQPDRPDRPDRPSGVPHVERIADDEYDVIPMNSTGARGMSLCQYSGTAAVNGTSPASARVAAALCDGFVKGQIRAKNMSVYFEQASEEAAGAYLSTRLLPAGLDPLAYVVLNVSLSTPSHEGAVDRPRIFGSDAIKYLDENGRLMTSEQVEARVAARTANRENDDTDGRRRLLQSSTQRYLELLVVNDHARYLQFNGDMDALEADTIYVVNVVNSLYENAFTPPLKILLKDMITFSVEDPYQLTDLSGSEESSEELIDDINAWRKSNLGTLTAHDTLHLFSGLDFDGTTIGLANQYGALGSGSICDASKYCTQSSPAGGPLDEGYCYFGSPNYCCLTGVSAAISQVHRETSQRDSITVAHEIGHQLGMSHDYLDDTRYDGCPRTGKIMAAVATSELEVDWSTCSISEYNANAGSIYQECLSETASNAVCGNGIVEPGEQCDCPNNNCTCYDHCCNGATCQLATNATCSATDGCCDETTCNVRASGTVCRASLGPCDTAETCDGVSKSCPADTITAYGTACVDTNGDAGACWANECRNRDYKCQKIGPYVHGGKKASGTCSPYTTSQQPGTSSACSSTSLQPWECFSRNDSCTASDTYYATNAPLGFPCGAATGGVHGNVCDGLGSCVALSSVMPTYTAPLPRLESVHARDCVAHPVPESYTPPPAPEPSTPTGQVPAPNLPSGSPPAGSAAPSDTRAAMHVCGTVFLVLLVFV